LWQERRGGPLESGLVLPLCSSLKADSHDDAGSSKGDRRDICISMHELGIAKKKKGKKGGPEIDRKNICDRVLSGRFGCPAPAPVRTCKEGAQERGTDPSRARGASFLPLPDYCRNFGKPIETYGLVESGRCNGLRSPQKAIIEYDF
jgi:hypothetical protein